MSAMPPPLSCALQEYWNRQLSWFREHKVCIYMAHASRGVYMYMYYAFELSAALAPQDNLTATTLPEP
jgi:hypothetical protein